MIAALLSLPILLTCLVALRWRLPHVLYLYLPTAVLANAYLGALVLAAILFIRFGPGREPVQLKRMGGILFICTAWLGYSIALAPVGEPIGRWLSELLQLLLGLLLLFAVITSANSRRDFVYIARGFVVLALLLSIYSVLRGGFGIAIAPDGPLGPHPHNYNSMFIVLGLVCIASSMYKLPESPRREAWSWTQTWLTVMCMAGILFNESRASLLAALVLLATLLVLRRPGSIKQLLGRAVWVSIASGVVIGFMLAVFPSSGLSQMVSSLFDFSGYNFSNMERLALILFSLQLFLEKLQGHGIGASSQLFSNSLLTEGAYPHPHNTLAMFAVEQGIVGIIIYLLIVGLLLSVIMTGLRRLTAAPCEARFVVAMAMMLIMFTVYEALFFNGTLAVTIFVAIGLVLGVKYWLRDHAFTSTASNSLSAA